MFSLKFISTQIRPSSALTKRIIEELKVSASYPGFGSRDSVRERLGTFWAGVSILNSRVRNHNIFNSPFSVNFGPVSGAYFASSKSKNG